MGKKYRTLPFCSEHLNVFIYIENSVFFKYRRVTFNFKTHMKKSEFLFLRILKQAPLSNKRPLKNVKNLKSAPGAHQIIGIIETFVTRDVDPEKTSRNIS